ncbi:hypothetical protein MUK42_02992 [Musa troglodytarum]|uniref:Uncharacterized protein n=1 Tax=Musa troglodytarum TaxID=320322 RepID=A0A9E7I7B4_9LILI|nr:hypothetical protein MUK42_02992 [Musa troglodytarum]
MVRLKVLSLTRTHEAGKILLAESRAFYAASAADRTFGNAGTARALIAASFFRHCTESRIYILLASVPDGRRNNRNTCSLVAGKLKTATKPC